MTTFARPSTPFPHMPASGAGSYFAFSPLPSVAPITEAPVQPIASSSRTTGRFARPLHFTLPALPTRTPPSLLKRSASSSSSSSASSRSDEREIKVARPTPASPSVTSTPPLAERRASSSSTSSSSSEASSPATPPQSMHLQLPAQPSYFRSAPVKAAPSYSYAAFPEFDSLDETPLTAVELLTDDAYDLAVAQAADFYSAPSAPFPSPAPKSYYAASYPSTIPSRLSTSSTAQRPKSPTRPKFKRRDTPRPVETISTLATISLSYEGRRVGSILEDTQRKRYTSMVDGGHWVVVA